jgi:hypothetical protein
MKKIDQIAKRGTNAIVGHYVPNSNHRLWKAKFVKGFAKPDLLGKTILTNWIAVFDGDAEAISSMLTDIDEGCHWARLADADYSRPAMNRKTDRIVPGYAQPEYRPGPKAVIRHLTCKMGGLKQTIHFAYLFDLETNSLHISEVVNDHLELIKKVSMQVSTTEWFDPLRKELYRTAECKIYDGLYNIMSADYMLKHLSNYKTWRFEVPDSLAGSEACVEAGLENLFEHCLIGDEFYGCTEEHVVETVHRDI